MQPPEPAWQCRRRWRNGSLGFVHWACRYGYEHRRHEGEQQMNISNCTTFVFGMNPCESVPAMSATLACSTVCGVCHQEFDDVESLVQHMQAPALPIRDTNAHSCPTCGRAFGSQRALEQHAQSCQRTPTPLKQECGYRDMAHVHEATDKLVRLDIAITSEAGLRLSHLARQFEKLRRYLTSKAAVKRAIARGELTLNSEHVEETRILKAGDIVTLCLDRTREALDATTARARDVKMVAPKAMPRADWQVSRSTCPEGVAVVWKPAGMRSLGSHAGTLQSSLPLLPEVSEVARFNRLLPLSRLEIGCCGLSLVPRLCTWRIFVNGTLLRTIL